MNGKRVRLSVVVIAYNEEAFIGPCLDCLAGQTVRPDEVIVVDNNSTDGTAAIARKYPFVRLIREKRQGMIYARNTGFDAAAGTLLARIDADTKLPERWVETVHRLMDPVSGTVYGLSGPGYVYDIRNPVLRMLVMNVLSRFGFFALTRLMQGHETMFGSNMVITRAAWNRVRKEACTDGLAVHEDIDLALHIGRYGTVAYSDAVMCGISSRPIRNPPAKLLWRLRIWPAMILSHLREFGPDYVPYRYRFL